MDMKCWGFMIGLGVAAGAIAVLALPKSNCVRKLATKAANKVEDVAWRVSDKLTDEFEM